MTDYERGYEDGFNNHKPRPGINRYPNNKNYTEGFKDGDWARVHMHIEHQRPYQGSNDTLID